MSWEDILKMPQGGGRRQWNYRFSRELERKIEEEFPGLIYVNSSVYGRDEEFETHLRTEERIDEEKDGVPDFKHYVFTHKEPLTDVEGVMQRIREEIKKDPYDIYETESQYDERLGL
jgi:predicted transcriptional regulator YdeE